MGQKLWDASYLWWRWGNLLRGCRRRVQRGSLTPYGPTKACWVSKAKNSEQWAAQKAAENERDKARTCLGWDSWKLMYEESMTSCSCCVVWIRFWLRLLRPSTNLGHRLARGKSPLHSVEAVLELTNVKEQAEAAQIKAESQAQGYASWPVLISRLRRYFWWWSPGYGFQRFGKTIK